MSCGNAEADYTGAAFSATDLTFELKEQGLARVTFTGSQPPITVDASWTLAQSDLADGDGVVGISYVISNVVPSTTIIGEPVCRLTSRVLEIHGSKFEQAGSNNLSMSAVVLARPALPS